MKRIMKRCLLVLLAVLILLPAGLPAALADDLSEAYWIWTDETENNTWLYFRRSFTLEAVPQIAEVKISAVDKYTLWVNGILVVIDGSLKRGDDRTSGYYDTVDLAPYLTEGENVISARVWYWGRREENRTTSTTFVEKGGFILDGMISSLHLVTDSSWLVYRETAYSNATKKAKLPNARIAEYSIYYEVANALQGDWTSIDYIPTDGWIQASELAKWGEVPYGALNPRVIPMIAFGDILEYPETEQYRNYRTPGKEDVVLSLPANIQFTPYLKVSTSRSIKITIYPENYKLSKVCATFVTSGEGEEEFEVPAWMSGDTVTYSVPGGVTILDLGYRESHYASEAVGSFTSDNPFFNTLWEMAAQTQHVCMRDTFMDCPDRERTQWWGDVASQITQSLYLLDENAGLLFEHGLKQKLGWAQNGELYTLIPSEETLSLPAQELAGIVATWNYYWFTGKREAVDEMLDVYLAYLSKWEVQENGLVGIRETIGWTSPTWYDAYIGEDPEILENAWYYWALCSVKNMCDLAGREEAWVSERIDSIRAAFDSAFWNGEAYCSRGKQTPDDRANAMAVLAGLAPEEHYPAVRKVLTEQLQCGTYMELYVLRALCEMGYTEDAMIRLQKRYEPMVSYNLENGKTTLWEYWALESGTSNHAWSACALYLLPRYLGGITPTSAGYQTVMIAPEFTGVDAIQVNVPTIHGIISLDAQSSGTMQLEIPEGITANVRIPVDVGTNVFVNDAKTTGTEEDGFTWLVLPGGSYDIIIS